MPTRATCPFETGAVCSDRRSRPDARRRRSPRSSRDDLRNQRRQLPPPCRTRAKAQGCRTTAELRDNQRQQRLVAPRQSNPNLALASNNPTKHHPFVAVTNPHLDCRALSSRLSRYRIKKASSCTDENTSNGVTLCPIARRDSVPSRRCPTEKADCLSETVSHSALYRKIA